MENVALSEADKVEMGLNMMKSMDRPVDAELRVLFFTATYFVLDGVTLTIRRIEAHIRSKGGVAKILTTVPEDMTAEQTRDVIQVPGIKIPFDHAGSYAFGVGLDPETIRQIEDYNPTCVHFTVPDFVALDGIRWCQNNNVAYIATWHSNYCDYLKYYFIEWVLGPAFHRYLKGFYEQIPAVYVPTPNVSETTVIAFFPPAPLHLHIIFLPYSHSFEISLIFSFFMPTRCWRRWRSGDMAHVLTSMNGEEDVI